MRWFVRAIGFGGALVAVQGRVCIVFRATLEEMASSESSGVAGGLAVGCTLALRRLGAAMLHEVASSAVGCVVMRTAA